MVLPIISSILIIYTIFLFILNKNVKLFKTIIVPFLALSFIFFTGCSIVARTPNSEMAEDEYVPIVYECNSVDQLYLDFIEDNGSYIYKYQHSEEVNQLKITFSSNTIMYGTSYINIWYGDINSYSGTYGIYYNGYWNKCLAGQSLLIPDDNFTIQFEKRDLDSEFQVSAIEETNDEFTYFIENGEASITSYNGKTDACVIPSSVENIPVTKINDYAFAYGKVSDEIYIPSSIKTIGENAFFWNFTITKVNIESLESWFNIDFESTYSNPCANRQTEMGLYIDGEQITDIYIPDGVKTLKKYCLLQLELNILSMGKVETVEDEAIQYCVIHQLVVTPSLQYMGSTVYTDALPAGIITSGECYTIVQNLNYRLNSRWWKGNEIYCMNIENLINNFTGFEYNIEKYKMLTIYVYVGSVEHRWYEYKCLLEDDVLVLYSEDCDTIYSFSL